MNIFNSLGSNYSADFVVSSLFGSSRRLAVKAVEKKLARHYGGRVTLTYKGRQALELALLKSNLPKGSGVAINGYTCYVVYEAVKNAGYRPVFVDVEEGQLNFGATELQQAHAKTKDIRAAIVQNTLGYPCDIEAIDKYCRRHNILLIEDLAHSFGARYADGREAGTVAPLVMLSFSQDKPLDVVAGGALVDRLDNYEVEEHLKKASLSARVKNRLYPLWSSLIRATYPFGIGRYLHGLLKKLKWLSTPMSEGLQGHQALSTKAATLLLRRWDHWQSELSNRKQIAQIYEKALPSSLQISGSGTPLYLRFPITVNKRLELIEYLKKFGIYIADIWYDAPVAPKKYMSRTNYQNGQCPRAEQLAETIVNLPTHRQIDHKKAHAIAERVNQWLKSQ